MTTELDPSVLSDRGIRKIAAQLYGEQTAEETPIEELLQMVEEDMRAGFGPRLVVEK